MKILITGGNGFIAKYLTDMIKKEYPNWEVDSPGKEDLDITNPNSFLSFGKKGYHVVVHLAALLMIDDNKPEDYFQVNTIGTYNVLEFCRKNRIKKIIYSMTHSDINKSLCSTIYPHSPQFYGTATWERNAIPFIESKIAAAEMIRAYQRMEVLQCLIFRLSNIRGFGSRDERYNCVFHQFIQKARKGQDIEIWGNPPKTRRDLIYVKDVCYAIIAGIEKSCLDKAFFTDFYTNIGSGKGLTILDEAKAIIDVFSPAENRSELVYRSSKEEVRKKSCIFDLTKTTESLGWQPIYSYKEGLEDYKKIAGW